MLLVTIQLSAQDILQWRGNDRTGVYNEKNLLKTWKAQGPDLLWNFDGLGEGHSSVVIHNGKIFTTGLKDGEGRVFVLDMQGKLLNSKSYGQEWNTSYNGSRGSITIDNGLLYMVSGTGNLVCMDENTLNIVWQKNIITEFGAENIKWGLAESPLIVGEKLIVTPGGKVNNVVALNKKDGSLIWSCAGEGGTSAYCSPLYLNDQEVPQVVTMTSTHIIGIDIKTGAKLWSFEQPNRWSVHANTPVYGDNMLLCTSGYGKGSTMLRLINGGRGVEKAWESLLLDNRMGAMVKIGNYAYGSGDTKRFWFCADWKTGEIKYQDATLSIGVVIAADGMLYCYSDKGEMALVKATPEKFDIVSQFPITLGTEQHWAHPVIANGIMYVRHGNTLMAYQIK